MTIIDRYASSIRSSNLSSKPDTNQSDSDVLGAAGLAAKHAPIAVALERLFSGDNHASPELVLMLGEMAWSRARREGVKMRRVQADDTARAVLAWERDGTCPECHGRGFQLIKGTTSLSDNECQACNGSKKVPFASAFTLEHLGIAWWLHDEIMREKGRAGGVMLHSLAPANGAG